MPQPLPIMYRVDEDAQQIVIPGRRLPQRMKLWLTLEGAVALHEAATKAIIAMPRDPEAIFRMDFPVLRMRPENEPQLVPVGGPEGVPPEDPAPMVPRLVVNRGGESEPTEIDPSDPAAPKVVEPGSEGPTEA